MSPISSVPCASYSLCVFTSTFSLLNVLGDDNHQNDNPSQHNSQCLTSIKLHNACHICMNQADVIMCLSELSINLENIHAMRVITLEFYYIN